MKFTQHHMQFVFLLFRPVPYPKDFYNDVQGKDEKASAHSRDIGNFSILQFQYLFFQCSYYVCVLAIIISFLL